MKLPQVQYGPVERITQGVGEITQAGVEAQQRASVLGKMEQSYKEMFAAHAAADTRNKFVEFRSQLKLLEEQQLDEANRQLDPQELRAHGVVVDEDRPVKGSLYAAPLFEKKAAALREQISSSVPAMFREKFDAMAEDETFQASGNVFNRAKQWKLDEDLADFGVNNEQLLRAGLWEDSRAIAREAAAAGTLNQRQLADSLRNTDVAEAQAPALAAIASGSLTGIEEEIEKLNSPDYDGPLDAKARQSIVTTLDQHRDRLTRELEKIETENKIWRFGNMEVGVVYGKGKNRLTPVHIEQAFRTDQITTSQRNQLTMQYWARIEKEKKDHEQLVMVEDAMAHGVKLSHLDSDHKKGVDAYVVGRFGTSIDAQKGTPEQRAAFEQGNVIVAANTGVLSSEGKAYIIGLNRSGDPEKVVQAANLYSQLLQVAPQTLSDISERDRVRLEVTAAMASSGVSPAVATKYGQEAVDRTPEQQAEIKATYAAAIKADGTSNGDSLEDFLGSDNAFDPFFGPPATSNNKIRTEYDSLVQTFFGQTGDLSLARDMAQARIRENWGRSEINGLPQAVKYSPEVRTGRSTKELRAEIEAQVAAGQYTTIAGSVGGNPVPIDPTKVIVTSDARTGKDNRYALQVIRPDGMLDNVYTLDGKRAYWNPMPEAKAAAEARRQEEIEAAQFKRRAWQAEPMEDFGGN